MSIYDVEGNVISAGGDSEESHITVVQNNAALVTEFLTVAQTYLGQTSIVYADGHTIFYNDYKTSNGIDCSTYVGLVMMGWTFAKSPYTTGVYFSVDEWEANTEDYAWALPTLRYHLSRYIDGSSPNSPVRVAAQIGRWLYNRNRVVPMSDGFRDVQPGDIVFYAIKNSSGQWVHPDWWMHINHIAIVLSKEDAPDTYVDSGGTTRAWDKDRFPYKHTLIQVGDTTPPCFNTYWLERGQEGTDMTKNNVNTVCLICRPDLGAMNGQG